MSRVIHKLEPDHWKEIDVEGNELVCYEYKRDSSRPAIELVGYEYRFNKTLVSVKRLGSKQLANLFN